MSDRETKRLTGKTVIVTGAAGDIGATSAHLFSENGANVVVADLRLDAAVAVAEQIRERGGNALAVSVDVTNYDENLAIVERTVGEFGRLDGIYANAGIHGGDTADQILPETWRRIIDIDLTGAFFSAKAALPVFLGQGGGSIVLQGSVCGNNGIKGTVAYSAAKAGLVGLTNQMAVEYAAHGVRVNCISPGTTRTQLVETLYRERAAIRGTTAESDLAKTAAGYPMQRLGTTAEIANLALFLLSDESSFITGTNIPVDGGFSAA